MNLLNAALALHQQVEKSKQLPMSLRLARAPHLVDLLVSVVVQLATQADAQQIEIQSMKKELSQCQKNGT